MLVKDNARVLLEKPETIRVLTTLITHRPIAETFNVSASLFFM